jgi:hypothetical protein
MDIPTLFLLFATGLLVEKMRWAPARSILPRFTLIINENSPLLKSTALLFDLSVDLFHVKRFISLLLLKLPRSL